MVFKDAEGCDVWLLLLPVDTGKWRSKHVKENLIKILYQFKLHCNFFHVTFLLIFIKASEDLSSFSDKCSV